MFSLVSFYLWCINCLAVRNGVYPQDIKDALLTILSNADCREIPNADNLDRSITQAARFIFLVKPSAALTLMNGDIQTARAILEFHVYSGAKICIQHVVSFTCQSLSKNHIW